MRIRSYIHAIAAKFAIAVLGLMATFELFVLDRLHGLDFLDAKTRLHLDTARHTMAVLTAPARQFAAFLRRALLHPDYSAGSFSAGRSIA